MRPSWRRLRLCGCQQVVIQRAVGSMVLPVDSQWARTTSIAAIRSKSRNHSWIDNFSNIRLPRNRLLPDGMRANDLKELFVIDARTDVAIFTIGSGASEPNARGDFTR
jgi:hypothetical protein